LAICRDLCAVRPNGSGLPNKEKVRIRQLYAEGKADRMALLERKPPPTTRRVPVLLRYGQHQPDGGGVYGDAAAGLVLCPAGCAAAQALTAAAARQVTRLTGNGNEWMPMGKMVDEKVVVNGIVALLATGGSTNHTMHLVAMARAAGILINWDDFSEISDVVPLMARLYPNGPADINHFQAAGGVPVLMRELLKGGLLHEDVNTVAGFGLQRYTMEPWLNNGELDWREGATRPGCAGYRHLRQTVLSSRRHQSAERQPRSRGDENLCRTGREPDYRSAGGGV
jgi:phosphogluconate dehydratase